MIGLLNNFELVQICNNIIINRAVDCVRSHGIWQKCFVGKNCTNYTHVVAGLLLRYKVSPIPLLSTLFWTIAHHLLFRSN